MHFVLSLSDCGAFSIRSWIYKLNRKDADLSNEATANTQKVNVDLKPMENCMNRDSKVFVISSDAKTV